MPSKYMSDEHLQEIKQLHTTGDWRRLLEEHKNGGEEQRGILWPTPDQEDLMFIDETVREVNKNRVVSIGCGTGFLEWCLSMATGLEVYGVEVDRKYWSQPRNRNKVFMDAVYPQDEQFHEITTCDKNALMFCYFNNGPAFTSYLHNYKGDCLVLIGPHKAGRHTDPEPFDNHLLKQGWILLRSKEIGHTKDYIAVYRKQQD